MNLGDIMSEIGQKLETFTDLDVFDYPADKVSAPAAILSYPQSIAYDETYGRGTDQINDLELWMVAGRVSSRDALDLISKWTAGKGTDSVKYFLEHQNYTHCDDVWVTRAEFDTFSIADIDYIIAVFYMTVVGDGE